MHMKLLETLRSTLTPMCIYNFFDPFFSKCTPEFFFGQKKMSKLPKWSQRKQKILDYLEQKNEKQKSFPLCVRGWKDFLLHNGALKVAFSLF